MMKRLTILWMCLAVSVALMADKHELDYLKEAVRVASTSSEVLSMPEWMRSDELAFDYCNNMAYQKEEQYCADTTLVIACFRQSEQLWDAYQVLLANPKLVKKLKVNSEAMAVMEQSVDDLRDPLLYERFAAVRTNADRYWQMRHEADARKMPEGRLLTMSYEEYGSSRPYPVFVKIEPDSTGRMMVTVVNAERPWTGEMLLAMASEELLAQVRSFIEAKKVHKMLRHSSLPTGFRDFPLPTGGPPSWSFYARFEDGSLSVSNDGWDRFGCGDELMSMLDHYVRKILADEVEASELKRVSIYKQWMAEGDENLVIDLTTEEFWRECLRSDDSIYEENMTYAILVKPTSKTAGRIIREDNEYFRYRDLTVSSVVLINSENKEIPLKAQNRRKPVRLRY